MNKHMIIYCVIIIKSVREFIIYIYVIPGLAGICGTTRKAAPEQQS